MNNINKILLVDDDAICNFVTSRLIANENFASEVLEYTMAEDAIEYLHQLKDTTEFPEIILLDINMPFMNGWEFIEEFKKLPKEATAKCKIFMLSSAVDISSIQSAKTHPIISDFISKPLTTEDLAWIKDGFQEEPGIMN